VHRWVARWDPKWVVKISLACKITTCNLWVLMVKLVILLEPKIQPNNNNSQKDFSQMHSLWVEWTNSNNRWVSANKTIWWWEVDFRIIIPWVDSSKHNSLLFRQINKTHNLNQVVSDHSIVLHHSNHQVLDSVDSTVLLHKNKMEMILVRSKLQTIRLVMCLLVVLLILIILEEVIKTTPADLHSVNLHQSKWTWEDLVLEDLVATYLLAQGLNGDLH